MRGFTLAAMVTTALCPTAASLAQPESGPTRKPGWWEMQMTISGPTPEPVHRTVHICSDPIVDKTQSPLHVNMLGRLCHETIGRTTTGWTISGACDSTDAKITQEAVSTGDLNDRYHVDVVTHMASPPSAADEKTTMAIDARWVGQCPAGTKPGDTEGYPKRSDLAGR